MTRWSDTFTPNWHQFQHYPDADRWPSNLHQSSYWTNDPLFTSCRHAPMLLTMGKANDGRTVTLNLTNIFISVRLVGTVSTLFAHAWHVAYNGQVDYRCRLCSRLSLFLFSCNTVVLQKRAHCWVSQFCLDFLKECPPSANSSLVSLRMWWDWFTHTPRCKLHCCTVVYTIVQGAQPTMSRTVCTTSTL